MGCLLVLTSLHSAISPRKKCARVTILAITRDYLLAKLICVCCCESVKRSVGEEGRPECGGFPLQLLALADSCKPVCEPQYLKINFTSDSDEDMKLK